MKRLFMQAVRFVGLSGIGWLLDFGIYIGIGYVSENLALNNMVSSWCGFTFVFVFAAGKVFQDGGRISRKWKYLIYVLYQCVLIFLVSRLLDCVHTAVVSSFDTGVILRFSTVISKILVTPVTVILNFLVMKGITEKL